MSRLSRLAALLLLMSIVAPVTTPLGCVDLSGVIRTARGHDGVPFESDVPSFAHGSLDGALPTTTQTVPARPDGEAVEPFWLGARASRSTDRPYTPEAQPQSGQMVPLVLRI